MLRLILPFLTLLLACITLQSPAQAGLLDGLTAKSFKAKIGTVEALAASGDPRVVAPLTAMLEGRLHIRKSDGILVIIEKRDGKKFFSDALSGEDLGVAKSRSSRKIRVNNRLRGVLRSALGSLTLFSTDPTQRLKAARAIFKTAGKDILPTLTKAYLGEADEYVREALARTIAATQLRHGSEGE